MRSFNLKDLKEKTIRGGFARLAAQGANFVLRVGSLMVLARLLVPADFGLVGMVTAITGVLQLFRDFGLSAAAIQRPTVTEEQISTLFWINMLVGALLGFLCVGLAPAVAAFYHEPRLVAVTSVLGAGFLFNAAGIQHGAILQRQLRFSALGVINTIAWTAAVAVGVIGAIAGFGYWALVAMTVTVPLAVTIGCWAATGWVPRLPHKRVGIRSMMRFGGALTLNGVVGYVASNFDKILIGRFWGAEAIGIYGRAYQLSNIPTSNLNSAAGDVAFSVLSRLQDNPTRFRSYFLKGYSLVLALTIPATVGCALFADDLISVVLGRKWTAVVPILRLLAPTILVSATVGPMWWLLMSLGMIRRIVKLGLLYAPVMIMGYVIGLPYGPKGVAFAYSCVLMLLAIPLIAWAVHGTAVSFGDILLAASKFLVSGAVAGGLAFGARLAYGQLLPPFPRLVLEMAVLLATFIPMLLFAAGQKQLYFDLFRSLKASFSGKEKTLVSAEVQ